MEKPDKCISNRARTYGTGSWISCYLIPKFLFQYFFDNCSLLVELFTYQDITAHVGLNTIQILCTLENTSELDIGLYKKLNNRYLKLNERDKSIFYLSCSGVFFFFFFFSIRFLCSHHLFSIRDIKWVIIFTLPQIYR